jgi:hypothetical protein
MAYLIATAGTKVRIGSKYLNFDNLVTININIQRKTVSYDFLVKTHDQLVFVDSSSSLIKNAVIFDKTATNLPCVLETEGKDILATFASFFYDSRKNAYLCTIVHPLVDTTKPVENLTSEQYEPILGLGTLMGMGKSPEPKTVPKISEPVDIDLAKANNLDI